jgi:ketosteroid isomerase-like protein
VTAFSWTVSKGMNEAPGAEEPAMVEVSADVPVVPEAEVMHASRPQPATPVGSVPGLGPRRPPTPLVRQKPESPSSHPNAQRIRECYAALEKRDLETAFRDFSPSFKLEVPAQLPYDPGDVRGPMVVMGLFRKMLELTGGMFKNELLMVTAADDMAVALNRVTVTRRGATRVYHASWTYRVVGDKIVEGWLHVSLSPEDLRAVFS